MDRFELSSDIAKINIIIKKNGKDLIRSFTLVKKEEFGELNKTLIKFTRPKEIEGSGLLVIEQPEKDDDIWFYMPDLDRAKRIITPERSPSFLGSDFAYEDLHTEDMKEYDYERVGTGFRGGKKCFLVQATPKSPKKIRETAYGKRIIWIRKGDYFKVREDYYDKKGVLLKSAIYSEPQYVGGGKYRMIYVNMHNSRTGNSSVLMVSPKISEYLIPDSMFTVEFLKKGVINDPR
jgi:hypothetical protein